MRLVESEITTDAIARGLVNTIKIKVYLKVVLYISCIQLVVIKKIILSLY